MNEAPDPRAFLAAVKGAPASIFLALVYAGGPLSIRELAQLTGYNRKSVAGSLEQLAEAGLAQFDERAGAWVLLRNSDLYTQLCQIVIDDLDKEESRLAVIVNEMVNHQWDLFTLTWKISPEIRNFFRRRQPRKKALPRGKNVPPTGPKEEKTAGSGPIAEKITQEQEKNPARAADLASSTTSSSTIDPVEVAVASKKKRPGTGKNSPSGEEKRELQVVDWLVKGGIGRNSRKMKDLLALDLELAFVKAHVLEQLAWQQGLAEVEKPLTTGLLIRKLSDGDLAPPLRCPDCLRVPGKFGVCGCSLGVERD